jgi:hypothetical protein
MIEVDKEDKEFCLFSKNIKVLLLMLKSKGKEERAPMFKSKVKISKSRRLQFSFKRE